MKKIIAILSILLLAASTAYAQRIDPPKLSPGQRWTVEATYLSAENEWSDPHVWTYVVRTIEDGAAIIEGYDATGTYPYSVELVLEMRDYSLRKADTQSMVRTNIYMQSQSYPEPRPVYDSSSLIPYDMPVLPLVAGSTEAYTATREVGGGYKARETLTQTVSLLDNADAMANLKVGVPDSTALFKVEVGKDSSDKIFTQIWAEGYPWPLYGDSSTMKYWLLPQ